MLVKRHVANIAARRPLLARCVAIAAACCGGAGLSCAQQCFPPTATPAFTVIQQAPPPRVEGMANYPYYPASAFATMQIDKIGASGTAKPMYFAQWANHGPRPVPKSNIGPKITLGSDTWELFSSIERADACTMAQTAALLGDEAAAAGFARDKVELRRTVSAGRFTDVCFLQPEVLSPRAAGIWLDYELGDGRTPEHTAAFLLDYAAYVHAHGRQVILYTDPLNAPSQARTGLDERNLGRIVDAFDLTSILLWGSNREHDIVASYQHQKAMIEPWRPARVFVVFELNRTSVEDARNVGALMKADGIRTLSFWRDQAKQGGSCDLPVNRKIACLAMGQC